MVALVFGAALGAWFVVSLGAGILVGKCIKHADCIETCHHF